MSSDDITILDSEVEAVEAMLPPPPPPQPPAVQAAPETPPVATVPAITEGPGALLSAIVSLARDPQVDVLKLQALLGMQERLEGRQAEIEYNRALARLPPMHVKKNGTIKLGDKGSVPFAKWEDMAAVIEPLLEAEGFRLMFDAAVREGGMAITGKLLHRDGHCGVATMPLGIDSGPGRNSLQAMGSTLSYGKRYTTEMLLNIVRDGEDKDGTLGTGKPLTEHQRDQMLAKFAEAKVPEGQFLARHTNGPAHAVEEVDQSDFVRLMNLLEQIRLQRTKREETA